MRQVKIFVKGPYDSISSFEMGINSWLEKMSDNQTFRLSDKIKIDSPGVGSLVYTFSYEIESEKEKEKRYEFGKKMADIAINRLVEAKIDPFVSDWEGK